MVEPFVNRVLKFGGEVQGPGQFRRFEHIHTGFFGPLAYALSEFIGSFGHQGRRAIRIRVIAERNCEMLRIGDDHICVLDLFHHAAVGHFTLTTANRCLDLGTPFRVFHFIFDFLAGHLQAFVGLVMLQRHIGQRDHDQSHAHPKTGIQNQIARMVNGRAQIHAVDGHQVIDIVGHRHPQNHADEEKLNNGFAQFNQRFHAEHTGKPRQRIKLTEFGCHQPHRKHQTTAEHRGQHRHHRQQKHDRQYQNIAVNNRLKKYAGQQLCLVHDLAVKLQLRGKQIAQFVKHEIASEAEKQRGRDQYGRCGQFNRTRQLPLFPRFGEALRGGFFGPF